MTVPVTVAYSGQQVTLRELARITGLKYETLSARYHNGDRGDKLVRARDAGGGPSTIKRVKEAQRLARLKERNERVRARRERSATELAAVVAGPLIAENLLTAAERRGIRERVRLSGQRSWSIDGGGY